MITNELRKLIKSRLMTLQSEYGIKDVYYQQAADNKMYPHIVFDLSKISSLQDSVRRDYMLDIDIFDHSKSATRIEDIADAVDTLFSGENLPQESILPSFFYEDRTEVPDEDKMIQHQNVRFVVQNYERT